MRLAGGRRRPVDAAEHEPLFEAIVGASQTGDLRTLEQVLAGEVVTSFPVAVAA